MKELNNFRKFLSENALGIDKGDGTFEITPDIEIMGQKFNFSDICPSAHKLVQNQALVHQGFSKTAPTVLMFAILHRDFFELEKEALGPQGIDVDTFNNDVTRLYTEILNVAEKLGVRKQAKKYMDMHLAKIKENGFKASEPGGSSDRNFEEQLKEAHNRWKSEVKGYTDLHENDVVLEAFLGESNAESNPLRGIKNMFQAIIPLKLDTRPIGSLGYAKAIEIEGDLNAIQFFTEYPDRYEKYKGLLSQAKGFGVDVGPNTNVLDAYNAIADAAKQYELRENLKEGAYETFDAIFMKLPFVAQIIAGLGFWGLVLGFFASLEEPGPIISYFRKKKAEKGGKSTYIDYDSGEEIEINENVFKKGLSSLKNLVKAVPNMMKMAKELKDTLTRAMELPGMQQAAENFDFKKMLDIFNSKADPEDKEKVETFKVKNGIRMGSNALQEGSYSDLVKENLEEGPVQTFTQGLDKYTKYPHVYVFKVRTMSTDKPNGKFVHDSRYEIEEDMTFNEAVKQAEYFISLPETIGINVSLYYTTGNTEGQLGGQVEVLRWTHDAWYKKAKSEYIQNAEKNKNEDIGAERIIAIRRWLNSSNMGRQPENVDNQEETWSTSTKNMKEKVKNILATK